MKSRLFIQWIFVCFFAVSSLAQAQVQKAEISCKKVIAKIQNRGQTAFRKAEQKQSPTPNRFYVRPIGELRDLVMVKLQVLNEEPYPFVDKSETPLANAWAKNIFNRLTPEQSKLLNMENIEKDLFETLALVKAYPSKVAKLLDEAANLEMEKRTLDHVRGSLIRRPKVDLTSFQPIEVAVPFYKDGKLQPTPRIEYYGSPAQLLIAAKRELPRDLKQLSKELHALAVKQNSDLQKLEVYVHELKRQSSLGDESSRNGLPQKYKDLVRDVGALYESGDVDGVVKLSFMPSFTAWSTWRWRAFTRQFVTIWWKKKAKFDKPDPSQRYSAENLWKFILSLTEEEKRSLGLANIYNGFSIFKQSRWGRIVITSLLPAVLGSGYGLGTDDEFGQPVLLGTLREFWANFSERDKCVHTESDVEFKKCIAAYLQKRFPKEYLYDLMDWESLVAGGEFRNEKITAVVEEIKSERRVYQQNKKLGTLLTSALNSALEDSSDVTSEAFRKALVKSKDESTMIMTLLSPTVGVGYFATRHPYAYQLSKLRALVRIAVENREDKNVWVATLSKLRDESFGVELADELEKFMKDRAAYLQTQTAIQDIDKMIEEAISVERGTANP